ncbi:hypothetical protein PGJ_00017960 [Porphyromonas gingivalis AJW4]|nr:hypothetical protein PGJ_00017960 [Porphyromonas gingivalis AJW4]
MARKLVFLSQYGSERNVAPPCEMNFWELDSGINTAHPPAKLHRRKNRKLLTLLSNHGRHSAGRRY